MSSVIYSGKRLIPAPFVSIQKNYETTPDGEKIGTTFTLNVVGTIVAFKGSPDSSQDFWTSSGFPPDEVIDTDARLASIIRKQEAIRELFSEDGLQFEVQSADGSQPMKCNPRVLSIDFPDEIWFDRASYTITLECDVLSVNGILLGEDNFNELISSASETWTIETQEDQPEGIDLPRTYRLSHTLTAQGKRFFNSSNALEKPAWQQARDWVLPKLGFDSTIALSSGVNNLPSYYQGFSHARSENIGERDGSYSVTETWIMASGAALEDFTVNSRESVDTGLTNVGIDGNIRGLAIYDNDLTLTTNAYDNAVVKFNQASGSALTRAQTYSGQTLNIAPVGSTIGRNPIAGTISYAFEYNTRPSNFFSDSKSEVVAMQDSFGADQFASIFVLGRTVGNVKQALGTKQDTTRALSIEVVFPPASGSPTERLIDSHPRQDAGRLATLQEIVDAVHPVLAGALNNVGDPATVAFVNDQTENWEPNRSRYSFNVSWTYE